VSTHPIIRKAERERTRRRVEKRNANSQCGRCGKEPVKAGTSPKTGKPYRNGESCIAGEAGRVTGRRAAHAIRAAATT